MDNQREIFNERPVYTLTEISKSLQSVINKTYTKAYYIKAEIAKLNVYPHSGHCYPELVEKDNNRICAQMRAVIWKAQFDNINEKFIKITGERIKEGISILCLATIEFSPQYGLALYIQDIEPSYTLGELMKNKLAVIARLKAEGIFTSNKQKTLPLLPKRIAVISVETSKGYSDFMVTLQQNSWGYCFECELFPSVLQGDKAISTITARLTEIEQRRQDFDCVVIVRGGGGDVGMSCYDDYTLASKVATFPLPVISGIGHSTNESITDMVSFTNKITPTEVAYFLIQQFHNFAIKLEEIQESIQKYVSLLLTEERHKVEQIENSYKLKATQFIAREKNRIEQSESNFQLASARFISSKKNQVEQCFLRLQLSSKQLLNSKKQALDTIESKIHLLHPDNVLKRGYSISLVNGKALTDTAKVKTGDKMVTKLYKGEIISEIQ